MGTEVDADSGKHYLAITPSERIPNEIALIFGDVVHNLRSALDHVVHAFVPKPTTKTQFPIYDTDVRFEKVVKEGKIADARHEVLMHIRACRADSRTHGALLALHELDIRDKHHLIVMLAGHVNLPRITFETVDLSESRLLDAPTKFSLHYQQKVVEIPTDAVGLVAMHQNLERRIEITLGEGRLAGKNVLDAVAELSNVVRSVIVGFPATL